MIFLAAILSLIVSFVFSAVLCLCDSYKYYKVTYEALTSGDYIFDYSIKNLYYFTPKKQKNTSYSFEPEILFFDERSLVTIKLASPGLNYIHNAAYTYFDPYSFYWLLKFNKWFKENKSTFVNA